MEVVVGAAVAMVVEAMAAMAAMVVGAGAAERVVDGAVKLPLLWMTRFQQILNSAKEPFSIFKTNIFLSKNKFVFTEVFESFFSWSKKKL
jgi:hypothetical protein